MTHVRFLQETLLDHSYPAAAKAVAVAEVVMT